MKLWQSWWIMQLTNTLESELLHYSKRSHVSALNSLELSWFHTTCDSYPPPDALYFCMIQHRNACACARYLHIRYRNPNRPGQLLGCRGSLKLCWRKLPHKGYWPTWICFPEILHRGDYRVKLNAIESLFGYHSFLHLNSEYRVPS